MTTPTLLSGIQANGNLHLGNLIGAINQWVALLDEYDSFVFLADLHALTVPEAAKESPLRDSSMEAAAIYVAAGLDPNRCHIYRQSDLAGYHTELTWYLLCVTGTGQLGRMTQFKSKAGSDRDSVGAGLFVYPVLQAADIALYDADVVPVGEDQAQHLELTRDVVERFNRHYGDVLVMPEALLPKVGARIMGLDNPEQKMSKSLAKTAPGHAIFLLDEPAVVARKLKRAVTDTDNNLDYETASPGVRNLIEIASALEGVDANEFVEEAGVSNYGGLKAAVTEVVNAALEPIQTTYRELIDDRDRLDTILTDGATYAEQVARRTIERVRNGQGLRPKPLIDNSRCC